MTVFDTIFDTVKATDVWHSMASTTENSQWHREESVAVHTEMTLNAYDKHFASQRTERQRLITKIALLFHDFGKPDAEETLAREDGSTYRRYAGHELLSANNFVDFITTGHSARDMLARACLGAVDLRAIRFMIEHHLPYDMKDDKLALLKANLIEMLGDDWIVFADMVQSDSLGRISDDHEAKMQRVAEWVEKFMNLQPATLVQSKDDAPVMYLMVGTSGSGKSTFTRNLLKTQLHVENFSLDDLRLLMYNTDHPDAIHTDESDWYHMAFDYSDINRQQFDDLVKRTFTDLIRNKKSFVLDNMNTAKKGRRKFISLARQAGYKIISVEFWLPVKTVLERQFTRGDKNVPKFVVTSSYMHTQVPSLAGTSPGKRGEIQGSEIDGYKICFSS